MMYGWALTSMKSHIFRLQHLHFGFRLMLPFFAAVLCACSVCRSASRESMACRSE